MEKILNKRKFRGRDKYLVQQRDYIVEENTWKPKENLVNAQELVDRFEKKYREEARRIKKGTWKKIIKKNYQENIQQNYYIDGMIRNLIENIRED